MSSGINDTSKDLEKEGNSKSLWDDDELLKAKINSMDEAKLDEIIDMLQQHANKFAEFRKSEAFVRAKQEMGEAADFENFYVSCFQEADALAEEKPGYTFTYNKRQSCAYNINLWLEHFNKIDAFVAKEIAPKLHAYIKEHGIPPFFPEYAVTRIVTLNPDSSVPFQTNKIGIYSQYCGPYHPTMPNGNFAHYFDKDNDCVVLKASLTMPTYTPNWRDDYDKEFSRLCVEADALDKQIQNIEDELARAEDDLKSYRVTQLTDIFDFAFLNSRRKEARKDIANAKQKIQTLIPDLKKQWEDILSSDAYDAARRRNEEAYEADCRLAAEWQRKWYEECQTKYREYYI